MKSLVLIAMLSLLVAGCASVDPPRAVFFNLEGETVTGPDAVSVADQLIERGHPDDALMVLEAGLTANPLDKAALELIVKTHQELAASLCAKGTFSGAAEHLQSALRAVEVCRNYALSEAFPNMDWLDRVRNLRKSLGVAIESLVRSVVERAESLYRNGKGFWNDDEAMFVEALVLLDGVKGLLVHVPISLRESYAAIWVKCYNELGSSDIANYKVRTAIVNGIRE